MDQNNIKRMFGSKRSLSLSSESQGEHTPQPKIVIPATGSFQKEAFSSAKPEAQKFYSEKELTPVQGSWNFKKSTPILEASLADYVAQERDHSLRQKQGLRETPPPSHKTTMSLDDLKSQTGVYHDYALSSHFDYSPAVEEPKAQPIQEQYLGEEVPYNMSYLPEETQAIPGTKGYSAFSKFASRTMVFLLIIIGLPLIALAGLYAVQGPEGDQWALVKNQMQRFVQYAQGSERELFVEGIIGKNTPVKAITKADYQNKNHRQANTASEKRRFGIGGAVLSSARQNYTDIPLMIKVPSEGISEKQLVKISGLPNNTELTKGHYMTSGVWMVPLQDVNQLALRVKGKLNRDIELKASFLKTTGQVIELASYKIPHDFANGGSVLRPTTKHETQTASKQNNENTTRHMTLASRHGTTGITTHSSQNAHHKQASLAAKNRKTSINPIRIHPVYEQQQLNRASLYLAKSDFDTARSILEKTANSGSARAATALARSYDPKFLLKIKVRGVKPDLNKAKFWYQKAIDLGNTDVVKRLSKLK